MELQEYLDSRSEPDLNSGCRLWSGSTVRGYGDTNARILPHRRAHRAAWIATNGPIPDGMSVCHRCDTPVCINPNHLFLGTVQDNNADRDAKGRTRLVVKLCAEQVRHLRAVYTPRSREFGFPALAKRLGLDPSTIRLAVRGITWADVGGEAAQ